ncbi:unnamed protein product [Vicia faba]|uniref:Uncharacterized protein n=1 Tax=Vicia faba TaxID=3906 RepID=A0AAV1A7W2_VICFA|nr:unnamed protein product [Vicia faba]
MINQKHGIMLGEVDIGISLSQLNLSPRVYVPDVDIHNIPRGDKSELNAEGNVIDVSLMYRPMRNHQFIQKYFGEETQETNMGNHGVDKDVPNILPDMLAESQIRKENDDCWT